MSGKKRIIVMIVLGLGGFALSFGVSMLPSKSNALAGDRQAELPSEPAILPAKLVAGTMGELSPRAQQLDSLVRELRFKIEDYNRRERALLQRERRLEMTQKVLEQQVQEIDGLRIELTAAIGPLKDAQADLESTRIHVSRQEEEKFRRLAAIYDKMDAMQASQTIAEMCQSSQIEDAVKLLLYMGERQAAKVLAEMPDKALAARLSLLMKRVVEDQDQQHSEP